MSCYQMSVQDDKNEPRIKYSFSQLTGGLVIRFIDSQRTKAVIFCAIILSIPALLLSCASSPRGAYKILSGTISVSNQKCDIEWHGKSPIQCSLIKSEGDESANIFAVTFPTNYFSVPPSCVFQDFGTSKAGRRKVKVSAAINLISTSEVRFELSNFRSEHYAGDPVFSFICAE